MKRVGLWLSIALAWLPGIAAAHSQPYSYLDLRIEGDGLHGRVMAHIVDLSHELGLAQPESLLTPEGSDRYAEGIRRILVDRMAVTADGARLVPSGIVLQRVPDRQAIALEWASPWKGEPGRLEVGCRLFPYDPSHETYLNIYEAGRLRHQDLLDRAHPEVDYFTGGSQGRWMVVRTFVAAGIHHIFIGPDHILFIIGLLLMGGRLTRLLKIISAFTVAHSVTLCLAAFRILNPPARVIEPAIALSIVLVGVENLIAARRGRDLRAAIAFAFGFVHGFGFANVLRELGLPSHALGLSLAAFNGGVEIGQACIVLTVAPLLLMARKWKPVLGWKILAYGSACVILAGGYWSVERLIHLW